jgi:hypothetical protein
MLFLSILTYTPYMKRLIGLLLLSSFCFFQACQKELSLETGGGTVASGTLQSDVTGECLPKNVAGIYEAGEELKPDSNYIEVDVLVTQAGIYTITTDTVNGIYFKASGVFPGSGIVTVKLKGAGTPISAGTYDYVVTFGSTSCSVSVITLPAGGAVPAVFTLEGSPNNCMLASISGTYTVGTALNSSNKVEIQVNVTVAGTYNITTVASNNITFSGQGVLLTGSQTITLTASGTPAVSGPTNIPVSVSTTAGTTSCSFSVDVTGPAVYTIDCAGAIVNGTYKQGTPLNAGNTITLPVTVTTIGGYSITGTINGMTFSASGTFTSTTPSVQNVTLTAAATSPTAAGTFYLPLTGGTAGCSVSITVSAASATDYFPRTANSNWSYEYNDMSNDSILIKAISPTFNGSGNTYNIFMYTFDAASGFDSSGYYRKSGGDYYEFIDMGTYLGFDDPMWTQYIFLKDNVAANTSWQSASFTGKVAGIPITCRLNYKIAQKDVTVNVNGVNYANTIVVEEKVDVSVAGTWQDFTSSVGHYKAYYSRDIGLIKYEYYDGTGALHSWQKIRRYQVF